MVFMMDTFSPEAMHNTAVIQVNSRPSKATIFIDNVLQPELTPCMIENIKAGKTHTLKIVKEGYRTVQAKIQFQMNQSYHLNYTLIPAN